jgi:hypothetical protein
MKLSMSMTLRAAIPRLLAAIAMRIELESG